MTSHILITGASSGIGASTAKKLAKEKKNLILVARREDRLKLVADECTKEGIDALVRPVDLTDRKKTEDLFKECEAMSLEAVINNAGMASGKDPLDELKEEDSDAMIDLDIKAFLRVLRLSLPHLKKTKGHLVNIGSIAGLEVYEGGAVYCGTKHFVHAASKGARIDLLGSGVRVTEIAPGAVDTEFSLVRFKGDRKKAKDVYEGYEPLHAEDIADAIWYALSCPKHVNVEHLLIMPTAQASARRVAKKS